MGSLEMFYREEMRCKKIGNNFKPFFHQVDPFRLRSHDELH
jgi:hypothetical protein